MANSTHVGMCDFVLSPIDWDRNHVESRPQLWTVSSWGWTKLMISSHSADRSQSITEACWCWGGASRRGSGWRGKELSQAGSSAPDAPLPWPSPMSALLRTPPCILPPASIITHRTVNVFKLEIILRGFFFGDKEGHELRITIGNKEKIKGCAWFPRSGSSSEHLGQDRVRHCTSCHCTKTDSSFYVLLE